MSSAIIKTIFGRCWLKPLTKKNRNVTLKKMYFIFRMIDWFAIEEYAC